MEALMQFKTRLFTLMLVVLLTLVVGQAVFAQGDGCFDLPADDCALVTAATENMADVESFSYDLTLDVSVSGLVMLQALGLQVPDSMAFTLVSNGVIDSTAEEGEIFFDLSMVVGEETVQRAATLMVVDEMVYFVIDGKAYSVEPSEDDMADLPVDIEAMDMASITETLDVGELTGMLAGYGLDPNAFVSYVRLDDAEMMGQTMYAFERSLDLGAMLNSPEVLAMIGMFAGDDPTMSAMLEPVMAGIASEISTLEYVGADDGYLHKVGANFSLVMDLSALLGPMDPIGLDLMVEADMGDINAAPAIVAPEGATMLTDEEAEAMMDEFFAPFEEFIDNLGIADMLP
jgi:hypothetical protein